MQRRTKKIKNYHQAASKAKNSTGQTGSFRLKFYSVNQTAHLHLKNIIESFHSSGTTTNLIVACEQALGSFLAAHIW